MLPPDAWRPGATLVALQQRAALLSRLRAYFADAGVLEVETPLLCRAAPSDPNLNSLTTLIDAAGEAPRTMYFQPSPEAPMKRLLAAGSGAIYQICKAFRGGEIGGRHNPEFTMLEWYRPGATLAEMADETEHLVMCATGLGQARRLRYREAMLEWAGIDYVSAGARELEQACTQAGATATLVRDLDRGQRLDYLQSHVVQPALGAGMSFLFGFPPEQAAMAMITDTNPPEADRFELYINGMEIANGYQELTDADELRCRIRVDNDARAARGDPLIPADEHLLAAMEHGLPCSAGVALGVDRLLLCAIGLEHISDVISFDVLRA